MSGTLREAWESQAEAWAAWARTPDHEPLAEDDRPRGQRGEQQNRNDDLHRDARLHDEADDRKLVTHS